MSKPIIKVKFQNGLTLEGFKKEVFDIYGLTSVYQFEETDNADFIIFGPYGNDIPPKGDYVRIGYFCENIKPDLSICEWAFGVPPEKDVDSTNYSHIQWHGLNPTFLIKPADYDAQKILTSKTKFCNFLYSNKIPYREAFFRRLSEYKKIDAPGSSMNNMPAIDSMYTGDRWEAKRSFLSPYKFTIAFESDISPGYQTEKLYDAMRADSMPIYCGDPLVGDIFNTKSFINALGYLPERTFMGNDKVVALGQMDFKDIRPAHFRDPKSRIKRKVKSLFRNYKTGFSGKDFDQLIAHIVKLDNDPELYLEYLRQPWLKNNREPDIHPVKKRWIEIFSRPKTNP